MTVRDAVPTPTLGHKPSPFLVGPAYPSGRQGCQRQSKPGDAHA